MRNEPYRAHLPRGRRNSGLAANFGKLVRLLRVQPDDLGGDFQRYGRHGQHSAFGSEQFGDHVQPGNRIAETFPQPDDQEIADGMIIERPSAAESVLQNVGPGTAGLVIAAQRRERHSEVPRRQAVKFVAKPAGRSAVVSDRDDRGQVVGHPAQRRQRGGQSMPAAEGHHSRKCRTQRAGRDEARHFAGAHSRPRSRCRTVVGNPVARSRRANSSAMAELRCLPPVQPMASVANRLPSAT